MQSRWVLSSVVSLWLLAALGPSVAPAHGQAPPDDRVFIYVVDISGSMAGLPSGSGNLDIFADVQGEIASDLELLRPGDRAYFFPFSEGIHTGLVDSVLVNGPGDVERAKTVVGALTTPGSNTWIYRSLLDVLEFIEGVPQESLVAVRIYTDGLDNGPESLTLEDILSRLRLARAEREHLYVRYRYFPQPGQPENPFPEEEGIPVELNVDDRALGSIIPVSIRPASFDLGNTLASGSSQFRLVFEYANSEIAGSEVTFEPVFEGVGVNIRPRPVPLSDRVVELTLEPIDGLSEGRYEGWMRVTSPDPRLSFMPEQVRVGFSLLRGRTSSLRVHTEIAESGMVQLEGVRLDQGASTRSLRVSARFDEPSPELNDDIHLMLEDTLRAGDLTPVLFLSPDSGAVEGVRELTLTRGSPEAWVTYRPDVSVLSGLSEGDYEARLRARSEALVDFEGLEGVSDIAFRFALRPPPPWWLPWLMRAVVIGAGLFLFYWLWPPVVAPLGSIGPLTPTGGFQLVWVGSKGRTPVNLTEASKRKGRSGWSGHWSRSKLRVGSGSQVDVDIGGQPRARFVIRRGILGRLAITATGAQEDSVKVGSRAVKPGMWVAIRPGREYESDGETMKIMKT